MSIEDSVQYLESGKTKKKLEGRGHTSALKREGLLDAHYSLDEVSLNAAEQAFAIGQKAKIMH